MSHVRVRVIIMVIMMRLYSCTVHSGIALVSIRHLFIAIQYTTVVYMVSAVVDISLPGFRHLRGSRSANSVFESVDIAGAACFPSASGQSHAPRRGLLRWPTLPATAHDCTGNRPMIRAHKNDRAGERGRMVRRTGSLQRPIRPVRKC